MSTDWQLMVYVYSSGYYRQSYFIFVVRRPLVFFRSVVISRYIVVIRQVLVFCCFIFILIYLCQYELRVPIRPIRSTFSDDKSIYNGHIPYDLSTQVICKNVNTYYIYSMFIIREHVFFLSPIDQVYVDQVRLLHLQTYFENTVLLEIRA